MMIWTTIGVDKKYGIVISVGIENHIQLCGVLDRITTNKRLTMLESPVNVFWDIAGHGDTTDDAVLCVIMINHLILVVK